MDIWRLQNGSKYWLHSSQRSTCRSPQDYPAYQWHNDHQFGSQVYHKQSTPHCQQASDKGIFSYSAQGHRQGVLSDHIPCWMGCSMSRTWKRSAAPQTLFWVVSGLGRGRVRNLVPNPTPVHNPYPSDSGRVSVRVWVVSQGKNLIYSI